MYHIYVIVKYHLCNLYRDIYCTYTHIVHASAWSMKASIIECSSDDELSITENIFYPWTTTISLSGLWVVVAGHSAPKLSYHVPWQTDLQSDSELMHLVSYCSYFAHPFRQNFFPGCMYLQHLTWPSQHVAGSQAYWGCCVFGVYTRLLQNTCSASFFLVRPAGHSKFSHVLKQHWGGQHPPKTKGLEGGPYATPHQVAGPQFPSHLQLLESPQSPFFQIGSDS